MRPYSLVIAGLVLMALLGGLGGCGESARDKDSPYGAVIAQVVWPPETQPAALSRPGGPIRWVVPEGVTTIKGFITAADIDTPPETTIAVAEGDAGTGLIENVPVGSDRTLTVQGQDAEGNVIFEGITSGITVSAGETTDAGTVELVAVTDGGGTDTVAPTASDISPADGATIVPSESIVITFDETMDTASLVLAGDLAAEADGGVWSETTAAADTLTISPTTEWSEGTDLTLTVDAADTAGNALVTLSLTYTVSATAGASLWGSMIWGTDAYTAK